MKTSLIIKNLAFGYAKKSIFEGLNFEFKTSTLIGVIGLNGVGKSTFLRTIAGLQAPIFGDVFIDDKNFNNLSIIEKAKNMSIVLTEALPESNITVHELVALGRQPYTNWLGKLSKTDIEKINLAIQQTEISEFLNKKHFEISDGQLQKVMIARALAQDTPIIILDEPTTHLDYKNKHILLKLLKKLTTEHQKIILFSTHDIDLAFSFCDEILLFTPNKIIKDTPKNIRLNEFKTFDFDKKFMY